MQKLEQLTPEQVELMSVVRDEWINRLSNKIDKYEARRGIEFIYELARLKKPEVLFVKSPMGCQYANHIIKALSSRASVRASVWASVRALVWASVWDSVQASVLASVLASVEASVGASVQASVGASVGASVQASVGASVGDFEPFAYYGNCSDYGWVAFVDYFTKIGILNNDLFNKFKQFIQSGIYDCIQLDGLCIVSQNPEFIKRGNNQRLHCETGPAIAWEDGYELYFWNGIEVPTNWIMDKDSITKEDILKVDNAEKRRCLREILGAKKYYEIIGGINGLKLLDQDTDDRGNEMFLYETSINDDIINRKVQFIEVTCPSTMRIYNIYPPNQQSKNVWEAKASTFNNEKIQIRHGDVGLLNLNKQFSKPILES